MFLFLDECLPMDGYINRYANALIIIGAVSK
jgi:hypothetical protein